MCDTAILNTDHGLSCGYCDGLIHYDPDTDAYVHSYDGARVTPGGPGDRVSARHNRAGGVVHPSDIVGAGCVSRILFGYCDSGCPCSSTPQTVDTRPR